MSDPDDVPVDQLTDDPAAGTARPARSRGGRLLVGNAMVVLGVAMVTLVVLALVVGVLLFQRERQMRKQATVLQAKLRVAQQDIAPGQGGRKTTSADRLAVAHEAGVQLQTAAAALLHSTSGTLWSATSWIPGFSKPMHAAHDLAVITNQVATEVVPTYQTALASVSGQSVAGGLNLKSLAAQQNALDHAASLVHSLAAQAATVPATGIGSLDNASRDLSQSLNRLSGYAGTLSVAAHVAPAMLGVDGPRTNLIVLQTPAEARGTGGLVGGYIQLKADDGKVTEVAEGTNHHLAPSPTPVLTTDLQFENLYGSRGATTDWSNSNLSPDFTEVGPIWAGLYKYDRGVQVDGVIGMTPEVLGRILAVTGPVKTADGLTVTAADAAYFLEKGLYAKYPAFDAETQRNAFQLAILHAVVARMLSYDGDPFALLTELGHAAGAGQVRLYSTHPAEESLLAQMPVAGALSSAPGPFFGIVTVNDDGNKLDAYLQRKLSYSRKAIPGDPKHQTVTGTVVLTNTAPASGLPAYVTYRADLTPAQRKTAIPGAHRVLVSTYLSTDAVLQQVLIDGVAAKPALTGRERNHLFVETAPGEILPGASVTVTVVAEEATSSAQPGTVVQPTVLPDQH